MGFDDLYEHCREHRSVATTGCAEAVGLDPRRLRHAARRDGWRAVRQRAWALPGAAPHPGEQAVAASLLVGGDVIIGGYAALRAHDAIPNGPSRIELVVPHTRRRSVLPDTRILRSRRWDRIDTVQLDGVAYASLGWTIALLGNRLPARRRRAIALHGVLHDQLEVAELYRIATLLRGTSLAGPLLALAAELEEDGSESGFEYDVRGRLAEEGLEPVAEQPGVRTPVGRDRRIDIAFLPEHVGIECVGRTYRATPAQFEAHVERRNEVAELDRWLILELTWRRFHEDFDGFVAQLRRCLELRRG